MSFECLSKNNNKKMKIFFSQLCVCCVPVMGPFHSSFKPFFLNSFILLFRYVICTAKEKSFPQLFVFFLRCSLYLSPGNLTTGSLPSHGKMGNSKNIPYPFPLGLLRVHQIFFFPCLLTRSPCLFVFYIIWFKGRLLSPCLLGSES